MTRLSILLLSLLVPSLVQGQCFTQSRQFVKQRVVQQAVVVPNVYYFVGAPLRMESLVEKAKMEDPEWEAFQQFKKFREFEAQQQSESSSPGLPQVSNVFASRCVACHNQEDSAGGYALDGSVRLDSKAKEEIMASVLSGRMPKGRDPLTPEELGDLVDHLFLKEGF